MRRRPRGDEGVATVTPGKSRRRAFPTADHVVSILPENADSRGFISAERLGQMKPGAICYNIGRGRDGRPAGPGREPAFRASRRGLA